jgi:class I lanthipeptide synthase
MTKVSWRPILTGVMRRRALEAVKEIADALPSCVRRQSPDALLANGHAGLAVASAYLAQSGLSNNRETNKYLKRASEILASETTATSLYGGFTGIAWALAHLQRRPLTAEMAASQERFDRVLLSHLAHDSWDGDYDLIDGLVGVGVYGLERLPDPTAVKCLKRLVDRLEERAIYQSNGITFSTPAHFLPDQQKERCPDGYYDIGVAHGVAGVIALLGGVCAAGVAYEKARALLGGTVKWLISQKMKGSSPGCFPYWVVPGIRRKRARLAWCYGDAGIASALLVAARCVKEPAWEREALEIARSSASRNPDRTAVVDAGLCHGAAGLGHIFNRIFQATGETWSQKAATFWFKRTLDLRVPGQGVAGFLSYWRDDNKKPQWIEEVGLLQGAAGIALALLSATTPTEPNWDRMLLLSFPHTPKLKTKNY